MQGRVRLVFDNQALEALDCLFDHLHVEIQADGGDVAGLLFAQEVSGAPDFEVCGGDAKPRPQFGELLNRNQPFLRVARECAFIGDQEVGEGLFASAPDAPA